MNASRPRACHLVVAALAMACSLSGCVEDGLFEVSATPAESDARADAGREGATTDPTSDAVPTTPGDSAPDAARFADAGLADTHPPEPAPEEDSGSAADGDGHDAAPDDPETPPLPLYPAAYPDDRPLSPITPYVARNLRDIAQRAPAHIQRNVFAKVGDSNTVNTNFLHCFGSDNADLGDHQDLATTRNWFRHNEAAGTTPYQRTSLSATVGWSAFHPLQGSPPPVQQEYDATAPAIALISFGTNDIQLRDFDRFGANLMDLADWFISRGTIPVFTTIPPRGDNAEANTHVPRYNHLARAVAQWRQVPFVDTHRDLVRLPSQGLISDGLHLNAYSGSAARACALTATGLQHGHNLRNLRTLQTLDRVRQVLDGQTGFETNSAPRQGRGTITEPFVIESLPFVDGGDTRLSEQSLLNRYDGCGSAADESGPEYVYRLVLTRPTRLRAFVADRNATDIDIHLLGSQPTTATCIARDHRTIARTLEAGTYHIVLDSYVANGQTLAGDFLLVVMEDPA